MKIAQLHLHISQYFAKPRQLNLPKTATKNSFAHTKGDSMSKRKYSKPKIELRQKITAESIETENQNICSYRRGTNVLAEAARFPMNQTCNNNNIICALSE